MGKNAQRRREAGPPPKPERDWFAVVRPVIEEVGRRLTGPQDDWLPVMFLGRGDRLEGPIDLTPAFASDEAAASFVDQWLPTVILVEQPDAVVLISPAWSVRIQPDDPLIERLEMGEMPPAFPRPARHPHHVETVTVQILRKSGSDSFWAAPVLRRAAEPPLLGPWIEEPPPTLGTAQRTHLMARRAFAMVAARN